jgi:hypothetical protein
VAFIDFALSLQSVAGAIVLRARQARVLRLATRAASRFPESHVELTLNRITAARAAARM